jgi:hypothetical protein
MGLFNDNQHQLSEASGSYGCDVSGWRPRRSVVFCSWGFNSVDGSVTPVLLNSEWGHLMQQRAVAYLGVDVTVEGKTNCFSMFAKMRGNVIVAFLH